VILVRQYRYGADAIHLELPAGTIDDGEDPRDCAIRELAEETGYEAGDVELIGSYRAEPARSTAFAYMFLATGARRTRDPLLDPTEIIEVELEPLESFRQMLRDGRIDNGASIATGYAAVDRLGAL
jgi:ADP-ribose pyrophosphatase